LLQKEAVRFAPMPYACPPKLELFTVGGFTLRRLSCTVGGRYLSFVVPQCGT